MKTSYHGNLILSDRILNDAYLTVENGIITYIGTDKIDDCVQVEGYIAPGFVDIHCHATPVTHGYDDPKGVANYHYDRGTTSMLLTIYRGLSHPEYIELISKIKDDMQRSKNLVGIHFEGPYLNCNYGAKSQAQDYPIKENYMQYLKTGLFKQWTCSPEVEGSMELIREIKKAGVVPAIGHSEASYKQVEEAVRSGAGIVTHIFDATGTTADGKPYVGTLDVSFNEACMLFDNLYYEVICDSMWIHVRKEMLKLLIKTVGIDKVVAITDCFSGGEDDGLDVNIVDGELCGSKLTMSTVARNLSNAGYTMSQIAKMTARNPARAINLEKRGEIAVGYYDDLIVVDKNYRYVKHLV